jgi:hypothetical protein
MSTQAAVARGRAAAEARMKDAAQIGKWATTTDPETLDDIQTMTAEHYSGGCRLRFPGNTVSDRNAGAQQYSVQDGVLSLPIALSGAVRTDDEGVITGVSPDDGDPALVGRRFRISGEPNQSQATAARFPVELLS